MSLYTCFGPSLKTTLVLFAALEEMDSLERERQRERETERKRKRQRHWGQGSMSNLTVSMLTREKRATSQGTSLGP